MSTDGKKELLRHALATLAYRGAKAVRGAPESFANFRASETTRSPVEILAHIGDLLDWALSIAKGDEIWRGKKPDPWEDEIAQFHAAAKRLDEYLASGGELGCPCERLFQGPIADALTHVGQIALLRRIAGVPIKGENYSKAKIVPGHVGSKQAAAEREFD